jgi:hypothetical protein
MKLQGSGVFHPKTLQSQNCPPAENRLSLNGLEFVHGQLCDLMEIPVTTTSCSREPIGIQRRRELLHSNSCDCPIVLLQLTLMTNKGAV